MKDYEKFMEEAFKDVRKEVDEGNVAYLNYMLVKDGEDYSLYSDQEACDGNMFIDLLLNTIVNLSKSLLEAGMDKGELCKFMAQATFDGMDDFEKEQMN